MRTIPSPVWAHTHRTSRFCIDEKFPVANVVLPSLVHLTSTECNFRLDPYRFGASDGYDAGQRLYRDVHTEDQIFGQPCLPTFIAGYLLEFSGNWYHHEWLEPNRELNSPLAREVFNLSSLFPINWLRIVTNLCWVRRKQVKLYKREFNYAYSCRHLMNGEFMIYQII